MKDMLIHSSNTGELLDVLKHGSSKTCKIVNMCMVGTPKLSSEKKLGKVDEMNVRGYGWLGKGVMHVWKRRREKHGQ